MAEAARELEALRVRLRSARRALKAVAGQQRAAIQLLAELEDDVDVALARLEPKAEEAQDERFSGTKLFV